MFVCERYSGQKLPEPLSFKTHNFASEFESTNLLGCSFKVNVVSIALDFLTLCS